MGWFSHKHRYEWKMIYNGPSVGAKVGVCDCGDEDVEITGAGDQQIGWWCQLGLTSTEARERVLAGDYPNLPLASF